MFCDAVSDADTQKGIIPSKSVKQQIIVNIRFIFFTSFLNKLSCLPALEAAFLRLLHKVL